MAENKIGFFARYLSLWVAGCIALGVFIGVLFPQLPQWLGKLEYANVSIPVAILIWLMIYPMMLKVDFKSIVNAGKKPKGLVITLVINWLVKPFTMYIIAYFFLKIIFKSFIPDDLSTEYLAGAILLGAAPCTAMVFVWSSLSDGDPGYTVVQVAVNDLIILVAFAPIVAFLLGVSHVQVPMDTLLFSVVLFVVIPLSAGFISRTVLIKKQGQDWFENDFCKKFEGITEAGLLLTLIIIFSFQGKTIMANPLAILLIAIPLIVQTYFIFFLGFGWSRLWKVPYAVAAPSGMIGASNFFELAVAVAISLFGLSSGATLATVVGVLVEVPVMLSLVKIARASREKFPQTNAF
ncbi:ACR3 family arsenite efflux transporter [Oceanispirochaeta sp.]|jgi:ACR3 family arsenite transporter|uniref:ACR3 family arsenite efflux transporter n=1 Tax=Oceanispirochaeta sp. TaxID=2035350 RepID=UPI00262D2D73|nr:ACR3 family arsenite efflux transporter [Oceanispirochaeta sp.]MDA3958684.1 ACR3 family arsenite efflux transporter [Oceanispirochaeta sp.]